MMNVGDKLKVEMELECISSPAQDKGSLCFRFADCIARATNDEGDEVGSVGGAISGSLYIDFAMEGRSLVLLGGSAMQWNAVVRALRDQYGVEISEMPEGEK